jgi:hypothetical protein
LWPRIDIELPPEKISQRVSDGGQLLNVMMQEYTAIRGEIQTSLSNQVSILSFGAATVGLLVAAGAALWQDEPWPTGLLLLVVVPVVCFLTLIIYAGELIRLMRAGLFLNRLENYVNEAAWTYLPHDSDKREAVLTWEQWRSIRTGPRDIDRSNRWAITSVFFLLAIVSSGLGYWRLKDAGTSENLIWLLVSTSVIVGGLAMVWVLWLSAYAYQHRRKYEYWADKAGLVHRYRMYLEQRSAEVVRPAIRPNSERRPLYGDLFNKTDNELIEAKGSVTPEAIRLGLGQLLDYGRFITPTPHMVLLVPMRPRPDLLGLLHAHRVSVVWEESPGHFAVDTAP